jgi:hypothetical protein
MEFSFSGAIDARNEGRGFLSAFYFEDQDLTKISVRLAGSVEGGGTIGIRRD